MARQFNGTSQYGVCSVELLSANVNYTLVTVFKVPTTQTNRGFLAGSVRPTSFARGNGIMLRGDQTGDPVAAYGCDGSDIFLNGSGVSEGAWHVASATRVGGGQTSQATQIKIDELTKVTGTTTGGASGTATSFQVAASRTNTGVVDYFAGLIDAVAIYGAVLSDTDLNSLGAGAHPSTVASEDLVELWVFDSDTGGTSTGVNGNVITWTGSPAYVADSPFSPAGPALTVSTDPITGSVSGTTDISTTATGYRITAGGVTITQALDGSPVTGTSFAIASLTRGNLPALASVAETGAQATVELMNGETVIDSDTVDLDTEAGTFAEVVASPDTSSAESIYNPLYCDGTPANGDQHQYTTPDGVAIDAAGLVTGEGEFSVRHWELATGTWGNWASYTISGGVIIPRNGLYGLGIQGPGITSTGIWGRGI